MATDEDYYKVAKSGKMRLLDVSRSDYEPGDEIFLKPKNKPIKILVKVSTMGERKIAIIPKIYWKFFTHRSEVYVKKF